MRISGRNLAQTFITLFMGATALYGCGDTTPDLEKGEFFDDSALVVSAPIVEVQLVWDSVSENVTDENLEDVLDEDGNPETKLVEAYRVTQISNGVDLEIVPGGSMLVADIGTEFDVRGLGPDVNSVGYKVEGILADGSFVETFSAATPSFGGRTLQFSWDAVANASDYRLTQIDGDYPVITQASLLFLATERFADIPVPVHLVDWRFSRFLLEANVDGVWTEIGRKELRGPAGQGNLSRNYIDTYVGQDDFASFADFYGISLALSENGKYLAVGATGDASGLKSQKTCPEDDADCDLDDIVPVSVESGAVYINDLENDSVVVLKSPSNQPGTAFGSGVAFSDDGLTLAVAAFGDPVDFQGVFTGDLTGDAYPGPDKPSSGAVYIYSYIEGCEPDPDAEVDICWPLEAYIKASNADAGDFFGWSVALSGDGDTLAVGAFEEDSGAAELDNSAAASGSAYVFSRAPVLDVDSGLESIVWTQDAYLKASNVDAGDEFGYDVALNADGTYLAVSSVREASNLGNPVTNELEKAGAVYVFAKADGAWPEIALLKAPNVTAGDRFGQSLSFDAAGELLAIGAPAEDSMSAGYVPVDAGGAGDANVGAVYLFRRSGNGLDSTWLQNDFYFKASNSVQGILFGKAVSLSSNGQYLAVGAWGEDSIAAGVGGNPDSDRSSGSGAVYIFSQSGSVDSWAEIAYVKGPSSVPQQFFGTELALGQAGKLLGVAGNAIFDCRIAPTRCLDSGLQEDQLVQFPAEVGVFLY